MENSSNTIPENNALQNNIGNKKRRIHFLDELRGFAIILVVFFHSFVTGSDLFDSKLAEKLLLFFMPLQGFFAGWFVVIAGISSRLSSNNLKRGLTVTGAGVLISVVLYFVMPSMMIWFGVLHLIGVSILLFALIRPLLDKIHPIVGIAIFSVFALITNWVSEEKGSFFGIKGLFEIPVPEVLKKVWLHPVGFKDVRTSDYFPLLPWFFIFIVGTFIGVWAKNGQFPEWTYKSRVPFLSFLGKHTMIIYLLHQPVIFGIFWIIEKTIK